MGVNCRCNSKKSVLEYFLGSPFLKKERLNTYIELLVARGIAVNQQNSNGGTALHYALEKSKDKDLRHFIPVLFHYGADLRIKDNEGRTAFDYVGNDEIRCMLKINYLRNSPVVKEKALLLLGAKHVNSREIAEFDGEN